MRVISGENRGTKLAAPPGLNTRPTDDRLKENIFNLIGIVEKDTKVLDLFAGSGQIGIEFLSRGSASCVFVDNNIKSVNCIKENIKKTRHVEQSIIMKSDVKNAISKLLGNKFDYIFLDPPYDNKKNLLEVFDIIHKSDIINDRTKIIIETVEDFQIKNANILKERVYGKRKILIIGGSNESDISRQL